jgi:D-serine deaminase-like pyridoxal phosphate-dependent protein
MTRAPALPGAPIAAIETPALLIDAAALERNLLRMARFSHGAGVALRAHAKTHKCPTIGLQQVALGAVGLCCQTVREAEAMVAGGIGDVLVSNQVVGQRKLDRLARLATQARVGVCVDDAGNVAELSNAAVRHDASIEVLVEIDVGMKRCGVAAGGPALDLARVVARSPGLRFMGLQAYHGGAQHFREHEERRAAIDHAIELCRQTRDMLRAAGLDCPVITGAGTGTFGLEAGSGVYTELQAGTYAFMDGDYARNRTSSGALFTDFEHSLFVLTSVISHVEPHLAVVDAGVKSIGVDAGLPTVTDLEGAEYTRASDEHGAIKLASATRRLRLGDKLQLIPGNCDPTVNLYDGYVVTRAGHVEALWPITARGPGY